MELDFAKLAADLLSYGTYVMMRNSGSTPVELEYFRDHAELEKKYQDKVEPEQLGRDIIDTANCRVLGGLQ